jgi:hypothetical protein
VDLLYSDNEGGQRAISRFLLSPEKTADRQDTIWVASVLRHRNLDRPDPRNPTDSLRQSDHAVDVSPSYNGN